jgi:hypothetical protein
MRHLIESKELMAPLAEGTKPEESGRGAASEGFLGESAPEDFLREVAATLAGFLKDESVARELDTGEAPSTH